MKAATDCLLTLVELYFLARGLCWIAIKVYRHFNKVP